MESNGLFSATQYGFRSARSTGNLLTLITDKICHVLHKRGEAKLIALDISKAFDKIWHKGLLYKLRSCGVSVKVFHIIKSFLSNRSLKVVLYGQHSSTFRITSGVLQGSILGPIHLLLIFINDLPENLLFKVAIFAADTSLYSCLNEKSNLSDRTELSNNLEHDLTTVSNWDSKWLVTFYSKKKQLLSINHYRNPVDIPISMSGKPLPNSSPLRLLWVVSLKILTPILWLSHSVRKVSILVVSFLVVSFHAPLCPMKFPSSVLLSWFL